MGAERLGVAPMKPLLPALFVALSISGCCFGGSSDTWPPPNGWWFCDQEAAYQTCRAQRAPPDLTPERAQALCNGIVRTDTCPHPTSGMLTGCGFTDTIDIYYDGSTEPAASSNGCLSAGGVPLSNPYEDLAGWP